MSEQRDWPDCAVKDWIEMQHYNAIAAAQMDEDLRRITDEQINEFERSAALVGLVKPDGLNGIGVQIVDADGKTMKHAVTGAKDPMEVIPLLAEWVRDKRGEYDYLDELSNDAA